MSMVGLAGLLPPGDEGLGGLSAPSEPPLWVSPGRDGWGSPGSGAAGPPAPGLEGERLKCC